MHSLDRYSGANNRMVLPNRCCVIKCARWPIVSRISAPAGEICAAETAVMVFIFPGTFMRGGGDGGERFFDERIQRQRIEFRDKTHEDNLANRRENSKLHPLAIVPSSTFS